MNLLERFKVFLDMQGLTVASERQLMHGVQLLVTDGAVTNPCTVFNNGNVLVQGKDSPLKDFLLTWAGKNPPEKDDLWGVGDLPAGWREWNENANWLKDYIKANGEPSEDRVNYRFKINREIMFHDYMFRTKQMSDIPYETIKFVVDNWLDRFCYMALNTDKIMSDIIAYTKHIWGQETDTSINIAQASDAICNVMCDHCLNKFVRDDSGELVCPQVRKNYDSCSINIVDALYPYSSAGEVVAYTKTNMRKLINRDYSLKWLDLAPSSPIEELMAEGLSTAGLLHVPQWQASDDKHRYRIDFVVKTSKGPYLAIECDGLEFHAKPQAYIKDRIRDRYLQHRGFYMMRFSSVEIFNNLGECLREIDEAFWRIQKGRLTLKEPPRNSYFGVDE